MNFLGFNGKWIFNVLAAMSFIFSPVAMAEIKKSSISNIENKDPARTDRSLNYQCIGIFAE